MVDASTPLYAKLEVSPIITGEGWAWFIGGVSSPAADPISGGGGMGQPKSEDITFWDQGFQWGPEGDWAEPTLLFLGEGDIFFKFKVRNFYNFTDSKGLSFLWWGSGGPDNEIDLELWTPTGSFLAEFPDGPAEWRWVFVSWGSMRQVGLGLDAPDRSKVGGIYFTYHTPGIRRVDKIARFDCGDLFSRFFVYYVGTELVFQQFTVRKADTASLSAEVLVRQSGSKSLFAEFITRHPGMSDLFADFTVKQWQENLFAKINVNNP